jgi:hypothetical protein
MPTYMYHKQSTEDGRILGRVQGSRLCIGQVELEVVQNEGFLEGRREQVHAGLTK